MNGGAQSVQSGFGTLSARHSSPLSFHVRNARFARFYKNYASLVICSRNRIAKKIIGLKAINDKSL